MAKDRIPQYPEVTVFITYHGFDQKLVVFCYTAIIRKVFRDEKGTGQPQRAAKNGEGVAVCGQKTYLHDPPTRI